MILRQRSVWRLALLLLTGCGPVVPAAAPPLEPGDFVPAGVPPEADSIEIRLSFGDPDSVVASAHPYDAFTSIVSWYYEDFIVRYEGSSLPASFLLLSRDEATVRGVRVGDPADLVLQRYGPPTYRHDAVWSYADAAEAVEPGVIEFLLERDTVMKIHLGRGGTP